MARVRQSTDASTINLDDIADSTFYGSISSWASIMEEAEKSEPESRTAMLEIAQARIDANRKFIRSLIDTMPHGTGQLIDADVSEASARLKALGAEFAHCLLGG